MGWLRRLLDRARQSDEERLSDEVRDWAQSIPRTQRIASCPRRQPVRISGLVRRLTLRPQDGSAILEAVVTDGTGEVAVQWTGRDRIEGLHLGTRVILEGVLGEQRHGGSKMVNPDFEFA